MHVLRCIEAAFCKKILILLHFLILDLHFVHFHIFFALGAISRPLPIFTFTFSSSISDFAVLDLQFTLPYIFSLGAISKEVHTL